jgi:hypothetical protein
MQALKKQTKRIANNVTSGLYSKLPFLFNPNIQSLFISFICFFYLAYTFLLDYEYNFILPEMSLYSNNALLNGYLLSHSDLILLFDWTSFDGAPRARFLSNFFLILNSKFRAFSFEYFPFFHTFSITWFITILNPIILFFTLRMLKFSILGSCLTAIIFSSSTAFLGSQNFYFHPAKPLAITFFLLAVYLNYLIKLRSPRIKICKEYYLLILLYSLGFYIDESCFFMPAITIVILRDKFQKDYKLLLPIFLIPIITFVFVVSFFVPFITNTFLNIPYDFWGWAIFSNDNLSLSTNILFSFYSNLFNLTFNNLFFLDRYGVHNFNFSSILIVLFIFFTLVFSVRKRAVFFYENLFLYVFFIFFQTLLLARRDEVLLDNFYYGGPSIIFFILFFVPIIFDSKKVIFTKGLLIFKLFIFIYFFYISVNNYTKINDVWRGNAGQHKILGFYDYYDYWLLRYDNDIINYFKFNHPNTRLRYYLKDLYLSTAKPKVIVTKPYSPVTKSWN